MPEGGSENHMNGKLCLEFILRLVAHITKLRALLCEDLTHLTSAQDTGYPDAIGEVIQSVHVIKKLSSDECYVILNVWSLIVVG